MDCFPYIEETNLASIVYDSCVLMLLQIIGLLNVFSPQKSLEEFADV